MPEYDFTLPILGLDELTEAAEDALYEAGLDDATLVQSECQVRACFTREAPTLEEAIASAAADIRKAGFDTDVSRVEVES